MSNLVPSINGNGNYQIVFKSPISIDNGYTNKFQGTYESTMELFINSGEPTMIEWDVPEMGRTEHIGLEFDNGKVNDYDGVFELPKEAIQLLESCGFKVDESLKDL